MLGLAVLLGFVIIVIATMVAVTAARRAALLLDDQPVPVASDALG